MTSGIKTIIYPVKDITAAKELFTTLSGGPPAFDQPYYVGFRIDGQDIGLDPHGHSKGMTGPVPYWHVDDIAKSIDGLVAGGATAGDAPHDVGGGRLIASVRDPDGNVIGLLQDTAGAGS